MKKSVEILALIDNWSKVYEILKTFMEEIEVPKKLVIPILLAAEEVFVNIAHYAYPVSRGNVMIDFIYLPERAVFEIRFKDSGIRFNPTKICPPDTTQSVKKRKIGGLGIFIVGKIMDTMEYAYSNGQNNLKLIKKIK